MDNLALFNQSEDYFSQSISRRAKDFYGVASAYSSDVQGEPQNALVIRAEVPSLKELLKDVDAFFALTKTSWCIAMRATLVNQEVKTILDAYGFAPADVSVAMVLKLDKMPCQESSDVLIKNMDKNLDQWTIPLQAYPHTSDDINLKYGKSHELALNNQRNLTHLSLFDKNDIISSLTLSLNDKWARIDDVATLAKYQGQGYATKLMQYALGLAYESARVCFLEASPKGLVIYQKLGFMELFKNQVFVKKTS